MPKTNLAPSQNWDVNNQIAQSKEINAQQNKELEDYNKKTEAIKRINSTLDNYESLGLDVTKYRDKLASKTQEMELGFGDKLGVVGRNIGSDYISSFSKAFGGTLEKSYQQKKDEAMQNREEIINPISTMASEVALDPLTYTPLSFASKGTKAVRAAKDFGKGAALSSGLYTAKEYGDEDFKANDALLAGAFGGALNAGIGRFVNRNVKGDLVNGDVTSHENIMQRGLQEGKKITVPRGDEVKKQTVETAEPIADEMFQEEVIDDDEIARRMMNNNTNDNIKPLNNIQDNTNQKVYTNIDERIKNRKLNKRIQDRLKEIEEQEKNIKVNRNPEDNKLELPPIKNEEENIPLVKRSKLPDSLPLDNRQEMEEIIKYAVKNNAEDEFLSKLPSNVNKEEALEFLLSLKPRQQNSDKITPIYINKKEPIKIYDQKMLTEFEGITKAIGQNTADVLDGISTNTQGVRNAIDRYIKGIATSKDYEILDTIERYMKYEGNAAREQISAPVDFDEAIAKGYTPEQADKMGLVPFANGENLGGAFAGGAESEFNQRDYDNDGEHTYKDNVIGALIGVLGVNGAKKIFPKAFKDENINKNTAGMFVGAKPSDKGAFSDIATKQTMREIDDSKAIIKPFEDGRVSHRLSEILDHDELFKKYPELKDIWVSKGKGNFYDGNNHIKIKDTESADNDIVSLMNKAEDDLYKKYEKLADKNGNLSPELEAQAEDEINAIYEKLRGYFTGQKRANKSTLLHEVQHAVQNKEGWAKGGSPDEFKKQFYKAEKNNLKVDEEIKSYIESIGKDNYESALNDYNKIYENLRKDEKYIIGKSRFDEDIIDIDSLQKDFDKATSNHLYVQYKNKISRLAEKKQYVPNYPNEVAMNNYQRLWGEQQARATGQRMNYTPEQRASEDWTKTLEKNEGKYNEPIIKHSDGIAMNTDKEVKEIAKSQDIKLNASPTISGGLVGGVVGATNDLDGDGKITAKDIAIGALGGAGSTKGIILAKNTNAVSKATKKLKDIVDTDFVNAFSGHKIYEKKSYMKNREAMIGNKNKKMEDFAELHEQLDLLSSDTKKDLHKYMSGENVTLSGPLKKLADNYKSQIEKQGQELVNLGILDNAQYEKFKGRYLHRVYEKDLLKDFSQAFKKGKTISGVHTRGREWTGTKTEYEKYLKDGKIGDFFGGKIEARKLNNGQYRFTQDWSIEQRARWGEVEDIAYTLPETLMRMNEMLEHGKFLQKVSKDMNVVSDEALDGYTQLKGKRFGALGDKYVPKDVADDITEFNRVMFGEEDGAIFSKEVKDAYNALSTFWKKSHTVYNPVAHVNNLMSNVTMQFMEGVNPAKALVNAKRGATAHAKLGEFRKLTAKKLIGLSNEETKKLNLLANDEDLKLYIKANDAGLFGRSRLNDILSQYVGPTKKSKVPGALRKIDEVSSDYYQGEDNIMRFSMLKSMIDKGESFDEAINHVNRTIPDYTKPMSSMARFGRKSMLTPFISWTYYSTPIILRQMKERPERAAAILGALYGINKAMGIDPYDKKDIPQQNFSMKRIPIYKNGNEVTTIKVDRWMPHNEILSPHDFVKNILNGGAWKGIYETLNNKNLYYGGKITHNEGARKAYDISKYGIQQITPDIIDKAWNLTESAILDKNQRAKNPVIQPRSTMQELLNAAGINTLTYDKRNQAKKVRNESMK